MKRHFTVTGFLVDGDRTMLHWHRKSQMWLPPGGHVDADEDPVQAVVREVLEETGIHAEILEQGTLYGFESPGQLPAPLTILVEDIPWPAEDDPSAGDAHQHIDLIYVLRPVAGAPPSTPEDDAFFWVSADQLARGEPLPLAACGVDMPLSEDVRVLALEAIRLAQGR